MALPRRLLFGLAMVVACGDATAPSTGLTGIVRRGPTAPVCVPDAPCDAPFAARFTVRQGSRAVTTFQSNSNGEFAVGLGPGDYTVTPNADAPVMAGQAMHVTVLSVGLTTVALEFDTGIR